MGNYPFIRHRHACDMRNLAQTSTEMATQYFKPVELGLADVGDAIELGESGMGRSRLIALQEFLERHELANAGRHCVEQQKQWPVLHVGELDFLVDK